MHFALAITHNLQCTVPSSMQANNHKQKGPLGLEEDSLGVVGVNSSSRTELDCFHQNCFNRTDAEVDIENQNGESINKEPQGEDSVDSSGSNGGDSMSARSTPSPEDADLALGTPVLPLKDVYDEKIEDDSNMLEIEEEFASDSFNEEEDQSSVSINTGREAAIRQSVFDLARDHFKNGIFQRILALLGVCFKCIMKKLKGGDSEEQVDAALEAVDILDPSTGNQLASSHLGQNTGIGQSGTSGGGASGTGGAGASTSASVGTASGAGAAQATAVVSQMATQAAVSAAGASASAASAAVAATASITTTIASAIASASVASQIGVTVGVAAVAAAAVSSGVVITQEARSNSTAPVVKGSDFVPPSCSLTSQIKQGLVELKIQGMPEDSLPQHRESIEEIFRDLYNNITGMCLDPFSRVLHKAELQNWSLGDAKTSSSNINSNSTTIKPANVLSAMSGRNTSMAPSLSRRLQLQTTIEVSQFFPLFAASFGYNIEPVLTPSGASQSDRRNSMQVVFATTKTVSPSENSVEQAEVIVLSIGQDTIQPFIETVEMNQGTIMTPFISNELSSLSQCLSDEVDQEVHKGMAKVCDDLMQLITGENNEDRAPINPDALAACLETPTDPSCQDILTTALETVANNKVDSMGEASLSGEVDESDISGSLGEEPTGNIPSSITENLEEEVPNKMPIVAGTSDGGASPVAAGMHPVVGILPSSQEISSQTGPVGSPGSQESHSPNSSVPTTAGGQLEYPTAVLDMASSPSGSSPVEDIHPTDPASVPQANPSTNPSAFPLPSASFRPTAVQPSTAPLPVDDPTVLYPSIPSAVVPTTSQAYKPSSIQAHPEMNPSSVAPNAPPTMLDSQIIASPSAVPLPATLTPSKGGTLTPSTGRTLTPSTAIGLLAFSNREESFSTVLLPQNTPGPVATVSLSPASVIGLNSFSNNNKKSKAPPAPSASSAQRGDANQYPTTQPIIVPTKLPTPPQSLQGTETPSSMPTSKATMGPSTLLTQQATFQATALPTLQPTEEPTREPTTQPNLQPTEEPTTQPTEEPTLQPTTEPTLQPTLNPTEEQSPFPTVSSGRPSGSPTSSPTNGPKMGPSLPPIPNPTPMPEAPSGQLTASPTDAPTGTPSIVPSLAPSITCNDISITNERNYYVYFAGDVTTISDQELAIAFSSGYNSLSKNSCAEDLDLVVPARRFTRRRLQQSSSAVIEFFVRTRQLSIGSLFPTSDDSTAFMGGFNSGMQGNAAVAIRVSDTLETGTPTRSPITSPTVSPAGSTTKPTTTSLTDLPTRMPTSLPTITPDALSVSPTQPPTTAPAVPPLKAPTGTPSPIPTVTPGPPTTAPSIVPMYTVSPTKAPTNSPNQAPTLAPVIVPTDTVGPTKAPTKPPSQAPTVASGTVPAVAPTNEPSKGPTKAPTRAPTHSPSTKTGLIPSAAPTSNPRFTKQVANSVNKY
ncbi:domain protein [Seminavis robusta]|uniref:Domain protein n=1 Tax=Seminavis robusta TaxID=568900 RepID=A0A9N8ERT0_9STRA|nr:domain protein [Seminavis robusta]|eukprot:Sro1913_g305010.1 domain protein (1447) ;mRNA; f:10141-14857